MRVEMKRNKHATLSSVCKTIGRDLSALYLRGVKAVLNIVAMISLLMAMTACQTMGIVATDLSCDVFMPITWSKEDSVHTSKQVREHNAAWVSLCVNK